MSSEPRGGAAGAPETADTGGTGDAGGTAGAGGTGDAGGTAGAGGTGDAGGTAGAGAQDELESLSTRELHDRAIHHAERHMDLKFMWSLLKMIPTAEVVSGDTGEGEYDAESMKGLIWDAVHSGEGRLGEALRPAFIDYLRRHPDA